MMGQAIVAGVVSASLTACMPSLPVANDLEPLPVTVMLDGSMTVDGQPVDVHALKARAGGRPVLLNAEPSRGRSNLSYAQFAKISETLQDHNIEVILVGEDNDQ